MTVHHQFGKWAEARAAQHLVTHGYEVLERNYRFDRAEIDIIARLGDQIVVVEVKARSTGYFGAPQDFISRRKVAQLVKAANHYLESNSLENEVRFDAIAIVKRGDDLLVDHIEDAFYFF